MKKILAYILLIFPLLTFAQHYSIEYNVFLNTLERKGTLVFNKNETSFYYESAKIETTEKTNKNESGIVEHQIIVGNSKNKIRYQIFSSKKDTLKNLDYIEDRQILYFENHPQILWEISDETKIISDYKCNKAITTFRGRKYTAWFSSELSINIGPWKFSGLPGLIFEIYDDSKAFSWNISKIIVNNVPTINIPALDEFEKISIEEFVKRDEDKKRERTNQMMLKYAERGAEIVERKYNRGRETIFEWEE